MPESNPQDGSIAKGLFWIFLISFILPFVFIMIIFIGTDLSNPGLGFTLQMATIISFSVSMSYTFLSILVLGIKGQKPMLILVVFSVPYSIGSMVLMLGVVASGFGR